MVDLDPDLRALQEVRDCVARAKAACEAIHGYDQARTDALCAAMAKAAANAAADLGRLAVEETGIGRVHYKVLKNLFGAEGTWASIRNEKTVGIVARDEKNGVLEVATAAGVIAGIIPTTNPTSTAIYKALIAVKGATIVISPHPARGDASARRWKSCAARSSARRAADLCSSNPTIESTAPAKHKDVALCSRRAARASCTRRTALGSLRTASVPATSRVRRPLGRRRVGGAGDHVEPELDNATLCCSEQGVVLDQPIAASFLSEMKKRGAYVCDERETERLGKLCNVRGGMNPDVVGLDPWKIAEKAGFSVPKHTTVLLAAQGGVGKDWPLSIEILAPILSVHTVDGWRAGCRTCIEMLEYGGLGHTLAIHAKDQAVLDAFFLEKPANRILVNGPASQGAVGYSTNLVPSMSLGCGPQAGNISSDNITARHLINIKRVAYLKRDWVETEKRDHARAAAMLGGAEPAPRGSGLPGDPAIGASPAPGATPRPTPERRTEEQLAGESLDDPARSGRAGRRRRRRRDRRLRAPRSPLPRSGRNGDRRPRSTCLHATAIAPRSSPYVGSALPPTRSRRSCSTRAGLSARACKGCPHYEIPTGACTA